MNAWIVETLVSSTLLLLAVLAARRPVARLFGTRAAYALWLLPMLRLLLPPLPGHRALYAPVWQVEDGQPIRIGLSAPAEILHSPLPPVAATPAWDLVSWLIGLWLAGAAIWFGWQVLRYRWFLARALRGATLLGIECGVEVLLSDGVHGPAAAGILRRRILLPRDFVARYDAAERRQALLHEGAHHDRHDLLANLAALVVVAVQWWNPLAHLAHRAFRADQELACDATVLAQADAAARYAYGRALVKSSGSGTPAAACALDNATAVKQRLRAIGRRGTAGPLRALGAALVAAAIGGGLFATASTGAPPASVAAEEPIEPALAPATGDVARETARIRRDARRLRQDGARLRRAGERQRLAAQLAARRGGEEARVAIAEEEDARRFAAFATARASAARISVEATRARMAAACIARGRPVAADERDWGELALCGKAAFRAEIRRTIALARPPARPAPPAIPAVPFRDADW